MAEAQAVPVERGGSGGAALERSWSVDWVEAVHGLLAGIWGKSYQPQDSEQAIEVEPPLDSGDGTGIDPHGGPRPRQNRKP